MSVVQCLRRHKPDVAHKVKGGITVACASFFEAPDGSLKPLDGDAHFPHWGAAEVNNVIAIDDLNLYQDLLKKAEDERDRGGGVCQRCLKDTLQRVWHIIEGNPYEVMQGTELVISSAIKILDDQFSLAELKKMRELGDRIPNRRVMPVKQSTDIEIVVRQPKVDETYRRDLLELQALSIRNEV